jgi:hypothetical protein
VASVTGFARTFRAELIPVSIFARLAMHFVWVIVIGFIAGIIARLLAPGPNNPAGFILTTLLGIAAHSSPPSSVKRSAGTGPIRARA